MVERVAWKARRSTAGMVGVGSCCRKENEKEKKRGEKEKCERRRVAWPWTKEKQRKVASQAIREERLLAHRRFPIPLSANCNPPWPRVFPLPLRLLVSSPSLLVPPSGVARLTALWTPFALLITSRHARRPAFVQAYRS